MRSALTAAMLFLTLLARPAVAFELRTDSEGDLVKWAKPVVLVVDSRLNDLLHDPGAVDAVMHAVQSLDDATPGLSVTATLGDPKKIGYVSGATDNTNSVVVLEDWPYQEHALAVTLVTLNPRTNELLDADIAFNADEHKFKVLPNDTAAANAMVRWDDVQNTLTHELGHVLGLMHSSMQSDLVMFPSAPPGEICKRDLKSDDRDGLLTLYTDGTEPAVVTPITPEAPNFGCSAAPSTTPLVFIVALGLWAVRRRRVARVLVPAVIALSSVQALAADVEPQVLAADDVASVVISKRESFFHPTRPGLILTRIEFTRVECLKGACQALGSTIVAGGRVGDLEQVVVHEPVPHVGDEVVVTRRAGWARVLPLETPRKVELIRVLKAESAQTSGSNRPQPAASQGSAITH